MACPHCKSSVTRKRAGATSLETELVYRQALATIPAARSAVFEYIEVFYNRKRLHSALGYQSPSTCEACRITQPETAPAA